MSGQLGWAASPGGEFAAQIEVEKGALARMIPFQTMAATVKVSGNRKLYSISTTGGKTGDHPREKSWDDVSIISPIEVPWVAEYAMKRWSVGGPAESYFSFEDTQRIRNAILYFEPNSDTAAGDAFAVLRVLKPDESPKSILKTQTSTKPGDVLVTFRDFKIAGFTVSVPIVGKLQFVAV